MTVSKNVFFIGAWRTQAVTDNLIRQISSQIISKQQKEKQKGYTTTLTLTSSGLELLIQNKAGKATRTDKIPLENIIDFIGNKYSSTCILAIVKDKQKLTVFVFLCSSERDAGDMVQTFGIIKKRLSGEGYNLNLTPKGTNWMLKTKQDAENSNVNIINNSGVEHVERIVINGDNTGSRVGEVRVLANGDVRHGVAESVSHESAELKDELVHLSDEVKAIKLMLEKQKPEQVYEQTHHEYKLVKEPIYQNTGDAKVIYHYETMAEQPAIKTQTIYTKNQKYGSRNYDSGGAYVMRGRTDTTQSRQSSMVSLPYSMRSEYTRRHYDSPNPMLDKSLTVKQAMTKYPASMRVMTTATPKGIYRKHALRKTYSGDTVVKHIEDVYKNRSFRRHVAVPLIINPKTTDYVQTTEVSPTAKQMQIVVSPPPEVHVKPVQREIVQENIELKNVKNVNETSNAYVVRYDTDGVQQADQTVENQYVKTTEYNTAVQVLNSDIHPERLVKLESNKNDIEVQDAVEVREGGDVIVIRAETVEGDVIQPGTTVLADDLGISTNVVVNYPDQHENQEVIATDENIIHIKAESAGPVRYVREYREVEVIDTRDKDDRNEGSENAENGESSRSSAHVIIREEHIKPPIMIRDNVEQVGEYNGEVRRITRNDKRVHYMEELNKNIGERRLSDTENVEITVNMNGSEGEIVVDKQKDTNNDNQEVDAEVKYILDEAKLKEFIKDPEIVIVEQEVNVKDDTTENYQQNIISENDLQRAENTVLF